MNLRDLDGQNVTFEDGIIRLGDDEGAARLDKKLAKELAEALSQWAATGEHHSLEAAEMTVDRPKLKM